MSSRRQKRLYFSTVKVPAYHGDNIQFAGEPEYWYGEIFDRQGKDVAQTDRYPTKKKAREAAIRKVQELEKGAIEVNSSA